MADFFNHNIPDDSDQVAGPPGTSLADQFRRLATAVYGMGVHTWNDPARSVLPWTGPVGAIAKQLPAVFSNRLRNLNPGDPGYTNPPSDNFENRYAGQYVGPNDLGKALHLPGYVPQQELQNLIDRDPLAGLLGPIQKPAPRPAAVEPGY
jgi:hypothetical protein